MACIHCMVEGEVQGVFFRVSTQQQAQHLRLRGWVKNRSDGRVELVACGDSNALVKLEDWLWQGPAHATVSQVSCERVNGAGVDIADDFDII